MMARTKTRAVDPKVFLDKIGTRQPISRYLRGRIVYAQGDPADSVFYIQKGKVKVTVQSRSGKEAVLAILSDREFFGEGCLNSHLQQRMASAAAMTDCSLVRISKASLLRMLRDDRKFSELFVSFLVQRGLRIQEDLADHLLSSSEKRLARVLLRLTNFGKDGRHKPVIASISQETLAEMVGTTRSRINHFMNKFCSLGFIEYNGGVRVHSSLMNFVLHD